MGSALEMEELVKFTMKGWMDMTARMLSFRQKAKLRGSAGSAEGWGTRRISSWLVWDAAHSRCSVVVDYQCGIKAT